MAENKDFVLDGLYPDPEDERDFDVIGYDQVADAVTAGGIQTEFPGMKEDLRIMNQGRSPMCVGFSGAQFMNIVNIITGAGIEVEPKALYDLSREMIPGTPPESGSYLRHLLRGMRREGWIERYYRIYKDDNFDDCLKQAIVVSQGVLLGIHSANWQKNGYVVYQAMEKGGHAVFACGYTEEGITLANSWGRGWGQNGFGILPWGETKKAIKDVWVPVPSLFV